MAIVQSLLLIAGFCLQANLLLGNIVSAHENIDLPESVPLVHPANFSETTPVNTSWLWRKSFYSLNPDVAKALRPLFDYQFVLPEQSLRAGLGYVGAARRLRKFVTDLLEGSRTLKIGVVGGSISHGMIASNRGVTDWFSIFVKWLTSVTKAEVKSLNGCRPATPSSYMVFCMEHSVDPEVDLIVIEYSLNDGFDDSIAKNSIVMGKEQLVRRLMKLTNQPAVVFLQVPHVWPHYVHPFYYTPEDVEGALVAYYDVQTVSLRTSMFLLNLHNPTPGFLWNETYSNRHPMDTGHKAMADLVIHLIQEVAVGLYTWPISEEEVSWRKMPLPPPMHEGNYEPTSATCLVVEAFANLSIFSEGWQWINEGTDTKPKWGFVSTIPGSELILRLGRPGVNGLAAAAVVKNATFPLLMHYLGSYTSMGQADVDCLGGCYCQARLDGWMSLPNGVKATVTRMALIDVTWKNQSLPCDLRLTVLNETSSDGHKFKVSGVVFASTNSLTSSHPVSTWTDF